MMNSLHGLPKSSANNEQHPATVIHKCCHDMAASYNAQIANGKVSHHPLTALQP